MNKGDLHVHTEASDSPLLAEAVFAQARRLGIQWLSITDHDTTKALEAAAAAAGQDRIGFIPGIEITAHHPNGSLVHILGYGIWAYGAIEIDKALAKTRRDRTDACREAVESIRKLGYDISWNQVQSFASGGDVFNQHIMSALVEAGYANRIKGILYKQLGAQDGPLSSRAGSVPVSEAIRLIHAARAIAVMAHPGLYGGLASAESVISLGIDGIEVYHPAHSPAMVQAALTLAERHNLVATGGSDYHGTYSDYDATLGCPDLTSKHINSLLERIDAKGGMGAIVHPDPVLTY